MIANLMRFFRGLEELATEDLAEAAVWMLEQSVRISVKAIVLLPTAQRSIQRWIRSGTVDAGSAGSQTLRGGSGIGAPRLCGSSPTKSALPVLRF